MSDLVEALRAALGAEQVITAENIGTDHFGDEALTAEPGQPDVLVFARSTNDVVETVRAAGALGTPVTARGAGTGLSGAAIARRGGILLSFERMNQILEIDVDNGVAVVQPGVTLDQLNDALEPLGLVYPVYPGENSATLGGNVATNAGGMRAIKYGVTRHHVLGLQAVLASGEVIRTGGKFVKSTSGYDLTQLLVGSEGTLALVTEVTVKLHPRLPHQATVLAPFPDVEAVARAVPRVVASGVEPLVLEYVDALAMAGTTAAVGLELGIDAETQAAAQAYLFVVLEGRDAERVDEDAGTTAALLSELGALDVYVLPPGPAAQLLDAREKAFWTAKASGATDIVDVVVPRASMPEYLAEVSRIAERHATWAAGAGHAGDGNVHLSVFQPDPAVRSQVMQEILAAGVALGGAVSAEHGIGSEKKPYLAALEDPVKLALMQRIKQAFDPAGLLNPGAVFDPLPAA